jgi:hypothetical protein
MSSKGSNSGKSLGGGGNDSDGRGKDKSKKRRKSRRVPAGGKSRKRKGNDDSDEGWIVLKNRERRAEKQQRRRREQGQRERRDERREHRLHKDSRDSRDYKKIYKNVMTVTNKVDSGRRRQTPRRRVAPTAGVSAVARMPTRRRAESDSDSEEEHNTMGGDSRLRRSSRQRNRELWLLFHTGRRYPVRACLKWHPCGSKPTVMTGAPVTWT